MAVLHPTVGQETLEATPGRVLKFVLAVSRYPSIRRRLMRRGYNKAAQDRAYNLLSRLGHFETTTSPDQSDPEVKSALSVLNHSDEDALKLTGSALRYKYPEQHEYMVNGLEGSTDEGKASQNIATILERITKLESGQSPEPTRAKAKEALEAMADKGLDEVWRRKYTALCETVRAVPDDSETREALLARERERQSLLLETRAFFEEWADTARVEFKGRRNLIRLGLARARRNEGSDDEGPDFIEDDGDDDDDDGSGSGGGAGGGGTGGGGAAGGTTSGTRSGGDAPSGGQLFP
jgi:hypothetical protein